MGGIIGVLLLVGIGYFVWFATVGAGKSLGKKVRCPRCGNYGMNSKGASYYSGSSPGRKSDWECPYCGHKFTR